MKKIITLFFVLASCSFFTVNTYAGTLTKDKALKVLIDYEKYPKKISNNFWNIKINSPLGQEIQRLIKSGYLVPYKGGPLDPDFKATEKGKDIVVEAHYNPIHKYWGIEVFTHKENVVQIGNILTDSKRGIAMVEYEVGYTPTEYYKTLYDKCCKNGNYDRFFCSINNTSPYNKIVKKEVHLKEWDEGWRISGLSLAVGSRTIDSSSQSRLSQPESVKPDSSASFSDDDENNIRKMIEAFVEFLKGKHDKQTLSKFIYFEGGKYPTDLDLENIIKEQKLSQPTDDDYKLETIKIVPDGPYGNRANVSMNVVVDGKSDISKYYVEKKINGAWYLFDERKSYSLPDLPSTAIKKGTPSETKIDCLTYYPLDEGIKYKYNFKYKDKRQPDYSSRVIKSQIELKEKMVTPIENVERKFTVFVAKENDGFYYYGYKKFGFNGKFHSKIFTIPRLILKSPISKGDIWDSAGRRYFVESVNDVVTVPAGTFKNCIKLKIQTYGSKGKLLAESHSWYARKVGTIKSEIDMGDGLRVTELVSFTKQ